jgi:integrase
MSALEMAGALMQANWWISRQFRRLSNVLASKYSFVSNLRGAAHRSCLTFPLASLTGQTASKDYHIRNATTSTADSKPPRLLDQIRAAIRTKHYSQRTEQAYVYWTRKFILFHGKRHPIEMGETEIGQFLQHLAVNKGVAASTQNQALNALIFLYGSVLNKPLGKLPHVFRAKRPKRLPDVLTQEQVQRLFAAMKGTSSLMARLLYGAGLRLTECTNLRMKDVDFTSNQILVRDGKGFKDRVTMLPESVREELLKWIGIIVLKQG